MFCYGLGRTNEPSLAICGHRGSSCCVLKSLLLQKDESSYVQNISIMHTTEVTFCKGDFPLDASVACACTRGVLRRVRRRKTRDFREGSVVQAAIAYVFKRSFTNDFLNCKSPYVADVFVNMGVPHLSDALRISYDA